MRVRATKPLLIGGACVCLTSRSARTARTARVVWNVSSSGVPMGSAQILPTPKTASAASVGVFAYLSSRILVLRLSAHRASTASSSGCVRTRWGVRVSRLRCASKTRCVACPMRNAMRASSAALMSARRRPARRIGAHLATARASPSSRILVRWWTVRRATSVWCSSPGPPRRHAYPRTSAFQMPTALTVRFVRRKFVRRNPAHQIGAHHVMVCASLRNPSCIDDPNVCPPGTSCIAMCWDCLEGDPNCEPGCTGSCEPDPLCRASEDCTTASGDPDR